MVNEFQKLNTENEKEINIENLKDLILTNEEYMNHPFAHTESERSYVFEINNGEKKIFYYGSSHTNESDDPIFKEIKKEFDRINPDIVYIEGWQSINNKKDTVRGVIKKESLDETKLEGENHFTLKLGIDAGKDFESPEPDFQKEIVYLLEKGFSKKDIFFFYTYRDIDQYQRQHKERKLEECKKYIESEFKIFRRDSGWDGAELDLLEKEIVAELDVNNTDKYHLQVDPIPWEGSSQTILNEVSRNSSNFRDEYIFERIAEGLKKHNKIFVVYGSAHAVKQEPALRALIEKIKNT